jgi:hypothetical protein
MDCYRLIDHDEVVKYGQVEDCYGTLSEALFLEKNMLNISRLTNDTKLALKRKIAMIYFMYAECCRLGKGRSHYYVIKRTDCEKPQSEQIELGTKKPISEKFPRSTFKQDEERYYDKTYIETMVSEIAMCDYDQAFELYQKGHQLGYEEASIYLGWCYYFGYGVQQNERKMIEIWMDLHLNGYIKASWWLGKMIYKQDIDGAKHSIGRFQALEMIHNASLANFPRAIILHAQTVEGNTPLYKKLLTKAINHEYQGIQNCEAYYLKSLREKNKYKQLRLLRSGAQLGSQNAKRELRSFLMISIEELYETY